jgi:MerR family transcriptional regulator, repressor of the yfmOP operon
MAAMDTEADTTSTEPYYRIDYVACRTGLSKRAIRYYEEIGLLEPQARSEGNYRLYSEADLARLEQICRLKDALGLTLAETKALLHLEEERKEIRTRYQQAEEVEDRIAQLTRAEATAQQQLALINSKLDALVQLRNETIARIQRYGELRASLSASAPEK